MTREQECFYLASYEQNMKKLALCDEYQKLGTVEDFKNALMFIEDMKEALQYSHTEDRDCAALDAYAEYRNRQGLDAPLKNIR